ncbi:MAG: type II toxin-antitoxin system VapC family toxin [Spirochaetota bacterium]
MIARIVIDTNAYSALFVGDESIAEVLAESEEILLCAVVIGELLDGFRGGSKETENRRQLERFRQKPRTVTVPVTATTAEWFAQIKQQLRRKGEPIPINDVWIAAVCMEHGAALLSADDHFARIDGLLRRPSA